MRNGRIFLVDDKNKRLLPMTEEPYAQEIILQDLISAYPDLMPGDQIDDERPRRWMLVKAEMGVPGMEAGSNRWSLDHLFLDQDGVPTFVECKRATDTRIRREVVAQMLDYAANGTEYWPVDRLRQAATETALVQGTSVDEVLSELLDDDDPEVREAYWDQVSENLSEGCVRLLFVADETPRELRRLVEFLNAKMSDVEALIVEVKQFRGRGQTAVVPRVIGQTEAARSRKGKSAAGLSARNRMLQAFWTQLSEKSNAVTKLFAGVPPSIESGLYTPGGRDGTQFAYRVTKDEARVAFYLNSNDPVLNRQRFVQLVENKEVIEAEYGQVINWDANEDRVRCNIESIVGRVGYRSEDHWPEVQRALVDGMVRFEEALRPYIEQLE